MSTSDHCPILLEPVIEKTSLSTNHFHFENAWLRDPMCSKIIQEAWESTVLVPFAERLEVCSKSLACWERDIAGSLKKCID